MESGDGFVLRIKPKMGVLNREQARTIGNIARDYGVAQIDITNKANVQIRGVRENDIAKVSQLLADKYLLDESTVLESRRNIVVNPMLLLSGLRSKADLIYTQLVNALDDYDHLITTPAKFSYLIDDYENPLLEKVGADIRFEIFPQSENTKVWLSFSGNRITATRVKCLDLDGAVALAIAASTGFFDSGLERHQFKDWMIEYIDNAHLWLAAKAQQVNEKNVSCVNISRNLNEHYKLLAHTNKFTYVSRRFGEFSATQWQEVVDTMARVELDELIVTPHRLLILPRSLDKSTIDNFQKQNASSTMDLNIYACPGKPSCQSAHGTTRVLFDYIEVECGALMDGTVNVHISGCQKGCAHPGRSELTILVEPEGFRLGFGKSARGVNSELLSKSELTLALNKLRDQYTHNQLLYKDAAEFMDALVPQEKNVPA
ncbi:MAG: hypothetical protein A3F41_02410 [Coxiella sp. RIFCSPHIGHO2_12_FULL_44_14]|nr:MAG: hypothetical protein A3F41_02410 [Coxiella sp. RIFCSPHIGHO2_12_FULL_44_14]